LMPMALRADPVSFGAMGCGPYLKNDVPAAQHYLRQENAERSVDFLIHLGDMFRVRPKMPGAQTTPAQSTPSPSTQPTKAEAEQPASDPANGEDLYRDFAALMTASNQLPTYIVPGDNEWNDTSDPTLARQWWEKHLLRFDLKFPSPPWKIQRQTAHPENFAFTHKGVAFVGLNIVGGRIHDAAEWQQRLKDNATWLTQFMQRPEARNNRALILMSQANPYMLGKTDPKDKYDPFLLPMRQFAATWAKPILYLHADGHKWIDDQPWPEKNIRRIQLERWEVRYPTTKFTIADSGEGVGIFQIERRLRQPQWKAPQPSPASTTTPPPISPNRARDM
jgi:hypothetical protein